MQNYDIAAYIWPAYTGDEERTRIFWPEGYGEWETVRAAKAKFDGHMWPRIPTWGYCNEADPYIMEMQINAAADHGVNVFIYDWYWYDNKPFLENCLNNGFLKARNNDRMKFYLMWANHTATTLWDVRTAEAGNYYPIWEGAVNFDIFKGIVDRTIEKYFTHPSYYKIDGKPVYMFYHLNNLITGLGGVKEAKKALEYFRKKTVEAGFVGLELQLVIHREEYLERSLDENTSVLDLINSGVFDSVTNYQYHSVTNMNRPYPEIVDSIKKYWENLDKLIKVPYYPHVSIGWDTNPRFRQVLNDVTTDNTPENIRKCFEMAKNYVDTHNLKAPLITVNSWNEWTEGSYLQPDNIYGYGYLNVIKDIFVK